MRRLWQHKNCPERLARAAKWDVKKGTEFVRPLFLNRSGLGISEKSVGNITNSVKKELALKRIDFRRNFHDLRATFATNLAKYMLDQGFDAGFIEYKLMSLLGHSDFSTTRKYLNFARSITFDSEIRGWTDTVFDGIENRLTQDYEHLIGSKDAE